MDINVRVKEIVSEALKGEAVGENTSRNDCQGWDSLAYLIIVSAVEREFHVRITPNNINKFDSIPNIVNEIKNAQNNS